MFGAGLFVSGCGAHTFLLLRQPSPTSASLDLSLVCFRAALTSRRGDVHGTRPEAKAPIPSVPTFRSFIF